MVTEVEKPLLFASANRALFAPEARNEEQAIQHNPTAPDGAEGLMGLVKFLKEKDPQRSSSIKRVMADGDLVMVHVHSKPTPDDRGTAIVDIFRLENGKIVEHWDVMQAVPETAKNSNTIF